MKTLFVLFFACTTICSCGQSIPICNKQNTNNLLIVDLYEAYQNRDNCLLSSFVESLDYLPLETTLDCLLGEYFNRIVITTDDIFIFDFRQRAYRFSIDGKFKNKVGKIGKGPGECIKPLDMVVDSINKQVALLDNDKLVWYDFDGKHIKTDPLKVKADKIIAVNQNTLLYNNKYYMYAKPSERFSMFFYSYKKKKELSKIACEKKDKIPFSICEPIIYKHNHQTFVKDYWSDTIYQVISPFQLKAHIAINSGKLKHRDNDDKSLFTGKKNPADTWVIDITRITETDRFIFLTSNKGLFIYDKKSKNTHCCNARRENEQWFVFNNNLTPGPDLMAPLKIYPVGTNSFVSYHYAHSFFKKNGALKNGLPPSLKELKPGDNPVLVFIKFKE